MRDSVKKHVDNVKMLADDDDFDLLSEIDYT